MADQAGRFVNDCEVAVFVYDPERYRLRQGQIRYGRRFARDYFVSGAQELACLRVAAVQQDISASNPGLDL
jgi:hypothetical protein